MRVSSKGRYAVVALLDVAENSGAKPVSLADVASRRKISLSYLEQLFAMLRRAGLVAASRGPGGGYRLARPEAEIRVSDVFRAVAEAGNGAENGRDWSEGPTAPLWDALETHIAQFLDRITLGDLMSGDRSGWPDLQPLPGGAQPPGSLSVHSKLA